MVEILEGNQALEEGADRIANAMREHLGGDIHNMQREGEEKERNYFTVTDKEGNLYAKGQLYEQGNVQLSFRAGIGECAEQYGNMGVFVNTFANKISKIEFEDE